MQKRTLKVAILAVLALVLVLGISSVALADQTWSDLPDTVTAKYGVTDNQVAAISEGFAGGLWKPYQSVNRAQFTKMAVAAFNIPLADPATASFTDVPKGSYYYPYIEGAKAAGAVNGTTATTFGPNTNITRQQAIAIVARYIADAQGFDLATMYTAAEVDTLLAHFGDVASISADLKKEVAFAFDMGLTNGDDFGNINPLANLTRIQGAALLIRAQALVPPNLWIPAKIEMVSKDKTEGLIGQTFTATFKVTDAAGHPAIGVLVDFDSLGGAEFYVGNVTQQAQVTDTAGQVTVDLVSMEPGTQRVSASVNGVGTIYTTRYWLVLDEVYTVGKPGTSVYSYAATQSAQNNVGVEHTWGVRVVVFGPGPRSTSQNDWYNAELIDYTDDYGIVHKYDPADIDEEDGVDANCFFIDVYDDGWNYQTELDLAKFWNLKPRTLAGIDVQWSIYDVADWPSTATLPGKSWTDESIVSVGNITKLDGVAVTPAKTAVGKTNADGYSSIVIYSEKTGETLTMAVADYAGNPYPEQLFNHNTFQDEQWHDIDWDDQPTTEADQYKNWIAHTIGSEAGPITPSYNSANIGEELTLTITLVDQYGNAQAGKSVEWFMQGVGWIETDDGGVVDALDYDVTNSSGKATLFVKSYEPGEQIVHAKVRDKGIGGAEGIWLTYTAEVQWFDADVVTFDNPATTTKWRPDPYRQSLLPQGSDISRFVFENNEALSPDPNLGPADPLAVNKVGTQHTFDLWAYGLKLEYAPSAGDLSLQTPIIDSDAAGSSYDKIFDAKDAAYFGGILLVNPYEDLYQWVDEMSTGGSVTGYTLTAYGAGFTVPPAVAFTGTYASWGHTAVAEAVVIGGSVAAIIITDPGAGYASAPTIAITGGTTTATATTTVSPIVYTAGDWKYRTGVAVEDGVVVANTLPETVTVAGVKIKKTLIGGITEFDWDQDGYKEDFDGVTGIYLPLKGKTVTFALANQDYPYGFDGKPASNLGPWFFGGYVKGVGSIVGATKATTDAAGKASVVVTSDVKGPQTIRGTVDWPGNPHNGPELLSAFAKKLWSASAVASTGVTIEVTVDGVLVARQVNGVSEELTDVSTTIFRNDPIYGPNDLNYAHVEVHVKDAYGNDLPDYEVVYLLNGVHDWMMGTPQSADTYIPYAYLVDNDPADEIGPPFLPGGYDQNGDAPDSDEPTPASDPYAPVVGPGGTHAFFFNQWNGSEKPTYAGQPGLVSWIGTPGAHDFDWYHDIAMNVLVWYEFPDWGPRDQNEIFDGFDGYIDNGYPKLYDIGLVTDGAKAWTLDGWFLYRQKENGGTVELPKLDLGTLTKNLLTGSNIDVQLAEDPTYWTDLELGDWHHYKSILGIKVYAPANGVVIDKEPLYKTQVHIVWTEDPAPPASIVLQQKRVNDPGSPPAWASALLEITGNSVDLRGMVKDRDGHALYAGGIVPKVLSWNAPDNYDNFTIYHSYKLMAKSMLADMYFMEIWDLSDGTYSADWEGWIADQMTGIPPTKVSFIAWLDEDEDNEIDSWELKSNEVISTFYALIP